MSDEDNKEGQKGSISVADLNKDFKDRLAEAKAMRVCENCDAWNRKTKTGGECRGVTPTIDHKGQGIWPFTRHDDWCRGFRTLDELRVIGRIR